LVVEGAKVAVEVVVENLKAYHCAILVSSKKESRDQLCRVEKYKEEAAL